MDVIQFTAPAHFASYFVNGDASGLSDDDKKHADAVLDIMVERHGSCHIHDAEELGFKHHMDYGSGGLAGDACLYSFLVPFTPLSGATSPR